MRSGVHIADVTDLNRSESANSFSTALGAPSVVEYVVTTPDVTSSTKSKERIIFGGTQITEIGSNVSSSSAELIKHEQEARDAHKFKGNWDGTFTYETKQPSTKTLASTGGPRSSQLASVPETFYSSEQTSSSSSVQQSSSSSNVTQTIIDKDGKVDVQSREWGSSRNRSSAEQFHAKSGTGITPEVSYSEAHNQEKIKYDTGKNGEKPQYARALDDVQRQVQQVGDSNPVEYQKERSEHVKYDDKTGKYLTDVASRENNRILDKNVKIIDSITLQQEMIQDNTAVINTIQDISNRALKNVSDSMNSAKNSSSSINQATTSQIAAGSTTNHQAMNHNRNQSDLMQSSMSSTTAINQASTSSSSSTVQHSTSESVTKSSSTIQKSSSTTSSDQINSQSTISSDNAKFISSSDNNQRFTSSDNTNQRVTSSDNTNQRITSTDHQGNRIVPSGSDNISSTSTITTSGAASQNNVKGTTTTYTSKKFDDKTKTWKIVDESTVTEKDFTSGTHKIPATTITTVTGPGGSTTTTSVDGQGNVIGNTSSSVIDNRSSKIDNRSSTINKSNASNVINQSSSTTKKIDSKSSTQVQQMYDEKTKSWKEVDERTVTTKRPSIVRYVSKESDGTVTTTYKKKMFDRRSGKWRVVEEKVYNNAHVNDHIPEMIDDVTNQTTTTYSTKVFDSKTGVWKVVDEKSYSDSKTFVPRDIVEEIERDHADVANITTTTEITKVNLHSICFY